MSTPNPEAVANELHDAYADDIDLSKSEIVSDFEELIDVYRVPPDEAKRSLERNYADRAGQDLQDANTDSSLGTLADVDGEGEWATVEVTFLEEHETNHENMVRAGILGDESGTMEFTMWDPDAHDSSELTVGESYHIDSVVGDEYAGQVSAKIVSTSDITPLDESIDVTHQRTRDETIQGTVSHIATDRSGLIQRCSNDNCSRLVPSGQCPDHGAIENPEHDVRIAGRLDTGDTTHSVIFDADLTESLTGVDVDESMSIAKANLSTDNPVARQFHDDVIGRDFVLSGITYEGYFLVNDIDERDAPDPTAIADRAQSL